MYSTKNNLVLGFHGCRKNVLEEIIMHKTAMNSSNNDYDWLSSGIYFWENNLQSAQTWAISCYGKNDAAV